MPANIAKLNPIVRERAEAAMAEVKKRKIADIFISQGFRSFAEQTALYNKRPRVTNAPAGYSFHNYGLAIDIAFNGPILYPPVTSSIWKKVAAVFEEFGFYWGGNFGDYPHFEMSFGLSFKQLLNGVKPPTSMSSLADRFKGEFLLSVEESGAIYYVTKSKGTKKRIPAGMSIEEFIKKTGDVTGIKKADLAKIPND